MQPSYVQKWDPPRGGENTQTCSEVRNKVNWPEKCKKPLVVNDIECVRKIQLW